MYQPRKGQEEVLYRQLLCFTQKLLKEGELVKCSRKEKQPRMFFLVSVFGKVGGGGGGGLLCLSPVSV